MKPFIKYIVLFLLPICLLAYPIDIYISNNLKESNDYFGEFEVWNDIYNGTINSENLVYGSSRAWVGINPQILADTLQTTVYNLGIDGHNFWLQYLRHLEYLKNNKTPKQIILAVDFGSLQKRKDLYLNEQFLPYMLWNSNVTKYTKSYIGYTYFDYYIPLIRYTGKPSVLKNAFTTIIKEKNSFPYRIRGYKGVVKEWTNEFELVRTKIKNYAVEINAASVNLLNTFLADCKKNNIDVVLVYTPEYIEGQKFIKNRQEVIDIYRTYAKKYKFHFLDYSKNNINYDKQYFYNATHLNKSGCELFSQILAGDLLALEEQTNNNSK
jgi:hypothetical protein